MPPGPETQPVPDHMKAENSATIGQADLLVQMCQAMGKSPVGAMSALLIGFVLVFRRCVKAETQAAELDALPAHARRLLAWVAEEEAAKTTNEMPAAG